MWNNERTGWPTMQGNPLQRNFRLGEGGSVKSYPGADLGGGAPGARPPPFRAIMIREGGGDFFQ